jgi:hypothetical protein
MIRTLLVAVLAPLFFVLSACDDLGKCTDPLNGRVPVTDANGRVMYAGQAIMQSACASCHGSNATGAGRAGAPAGLDFDVLPLEATGTTTVNGQMVGTTMDAAGMSGLRRRQRKIFDLRELIWEQVIDGLMPPSGLGDPYKKISPGAKVTGFSADGGCTKDTPYAGVSNKATQKVLQQWLACGAPVVEMNVAALPEPVGGTVGDQYPSCGGAPMEATFENMYMAIVVGGTCAVAGCHLGDSSQAGFDLAMDKAYVEMVGADMTGGASTCMGAKMVVPGDPANSYLLTKLGGETDLTICNTIMPPAGKLPQATLDLLEAWIMAGAPGPGESGDGT